MNYEEKLFETLVVIRSQISWAHHVILTRMDINDIKQAQERTRDYVKRTPLEYSETLSKRLCTNVYIKYELFQKTGAFKARGAFNKLLSMSEQTRGNGVVAVSGGNHAQAVAYASNVLGVDAVLLLPENTPTFFVYSTL